VNTHCAFVTLPSRTDAAIATTLSFSEDADHWVISHAPEASTIRWQALATEPSAWRSVAGYVLIGLLYAGFSPICIIISGAAQRVDLGPFQPAWAALAPTLGLTVFLAMLPTVLLLIIGFCFLPRSDSAAQHRLQFWYFLFLVFFVLVLPIIGTNFRSFAHQIYGSPASVFSLVADRIPTAAEFFFDYIVLMWSVACVELLRAATLVKFLIFRTLYPEDEAKKMAEPEDQDFYGMGGRMARWNLNLSIGIVFCSVFPLVSVAVLIKFLLQKVAYGYLLAFAETRKPDLGGVFWVESLTQLQYCVAFYAVMMFGVLAQRSSSAVPAALAFLGAFCSVCSVLQFSSRFRWQSLPFPEVVKLDQDEPLGTSTALTPSDTYSHPALREG